MLERVPALHVGLLQIYDDVRQQIRRADGMDVRVSRYLENQMRKLVRQMRAQAVRQHLQGIFMDQALNHFGTLRRVVRRLQAGNGRRFQERRRRQGHGYRQGTDAYG